MSPVRRIQALWSVYESVGQRAMLEHLPDECEWVPPEDLPDAHVVRGPDEIRAYLKRLRRDGVRLEPALHTYELLDEHVVLVRGRMRVVANSTLADSPLYWLCRMRGDDVVRIESYACRDDALVAAAA